MNPEEQVRQVFEFYCTLLQDVDKLNRTIELYQVKLKSSFLGHTWVPYVCSQVYWSL